MPKTYVSKSKSKPLIFLCLLTKLLRKPINGLYGLTGKFFRIYRVEYINTENIDKDIVFRNLP